MKRILPIFLILVSLNAIAASETIPNDRSIVSLNVYKDLIVVKFFPRFQNSQGCSNSTTQVVQFYFADDPTKSMFSSVLAAAASKSQIGFGISGCAGQYPKVYRVDTKY